MKPEWGTGTRILFRFVFAYLLLYNFPFPLDNIPVYGSMLVEPYTELWNTAVPWVGKHVFGVEVLFQPGGSGDTTYNYVQLACYLAIAILAALIWSLLDRKRPDDSRLYEWLRVYVRFSLAAAMMWYGAGKVLPAQFPEPWLGRLLQPIGEASPMGLLWTFMGASVSYSVFAGLAEVLGGLLLVARRTTLLGALVCIGVMANIAMLNFSYDVPVKLYSSHLLLMAVFLAAPDLRRLARLFVLNRKVEPAEIRPLFTDRRRHRAALAFRTVFILVVTGAAFYQSYDAMRQYGAWALERPLYGIWDVEKFALAGVDRPPLATDEIRWRRVIIDWPGAIGVQRTKDSDIQYFGLKLNSGPHRFALEGWGEPASNGTLSYKKLSPGLILLNGTLDGKPLQARLRRIDETRMRLTGRGFHWINEYPMNQ